MLKDDLEIIIITFNRKNKLQKTLDKLLLPESPLKDYEIKILNNHSTDGTTELLEEYASRYSNLKHIVNNKNLGIAGNIIKAMEIASKKWLWVLCDDDDYDFSNWGEIENALKQDYDIVHTTYTEGFRNETYPYLINEEAFIPTAIYNTKHITELTMNNAYIMAYTLLPHHAIGGKVINENGKIFVPKNRFVLQSYDDKNNFKRIPRKGMYHRLDNFQLLAGYISAYQIIEDPEIRYQCCNTLCLGQDFRGSMLWFLHENHGDLYNLSDVFLGINNKQKLILLKILCPRVFKSIYQSIFSIKNRDGFKVITILGHKFKIKKKN